jgi:hypothetical protein
MNTGKCFFRLLPARLMVGLYAETKALYAEMDEPATLALMSVPAMVKRDSGQMVLNRSFDVDYESSHDARLEEGCMGC